MKGQFEISDELAAEVCKKFNWNLGQLTNEIIAQQLNNWNHNIGWFARRKTPFGTTQYVWDDIFGEKIMHRSYINYLLMMQEDGWELAYDIVKNNDAN